MPLIPRRTPGRAFVVAAIAATATVALAAGPAAAHVTVNPSTAAQGGYAKLTFRVPNERANANTTQLEVDLPANAPLQSVSVEPVPGWTYQVTKTPLPQPIQTEDGSISEVVSRITWSGGAIKPGEFQEFSISAGPLPKASSITFKALQTYDSGDVVRWIEERTAGGAEPANPAPVLTLTAGGTGDTAAPAATSTSDSDGTARALGIAGIVLGAGGLLAAGAVLVLARRRPAGPPPTA